MAITHPDYQSNPQHETPAETTSNPRESTPNSCDSAPRLQIVGEKFTAPPADGAIAPGSVVIDADAASLLNLVLQQLRDGGTIAAPAPVVSGSGIPLTALKRISDDWLFHVRHGEGLSRRTVESYEWSVGVLLEFLRARATHTGMASTCSAELLRELFDYLAILGDGERGTQTRNSQPRGAQTYFDEIGLPVVPLTGAQKPGARTRQLHYINLRVMFNWAVKRGLLAASPLHTIAAPRAVAKHVQPFGEGDVLRLIAAAKKSDHPRRNVAILMVMFDCGLRAQETCDLLVSDVDWSERLLLVRHGKGDKERTVAFSPETLTALWNYLKEQPGEHGGALFRSQRGVKAGRHLTVSGVRRLFIRLGEAAGLDSSIRCTPHTMRHAFASSFLMNGATAEDLQRMLGHSTTQMSMHYVTVNKQHLQEKHLRHSPVSRMLKKR